MILDCQLIATSTLYQLCGGIDLIKQDLCHFDWCGAWFVQQKCHFFLREKTQLCFLGSMENDSVTTIEIDDTDLKLFNIISWCIYHVINDIIILHANPLTG